MLALLVTNTTRLLRLRSFSRTPNAPGIRSSPDQMTPSQSAWWSARLAGSRKRKRVDTNRTGRCHSDRAPRTAHSSTADICTAWRMTFAPHPCLLKVLVWLDINRTIATAATSTPGGESAAASVDPRILVLSVSPDQSSTYIPIMNSIFSAQKLVSDTRGVFLSELTPTRVPPESHHRCVQNLRRG